MKKLLFSGMPFEAGQSKMGLYQSAIRARDYFSLLENWSLEFLDQGDVGEVFTHDKIKIFSEHDLRKFNFSHFIEAYSKTLELLEKPFPLVNWGGDHSLALSTVSAFTSHYPEGKVIWIDAHADVNLPSKSTSGNLHGMPLALLMNISHIAEKNCPWIKNNLRPENLIYLGLRDTDPYEKEFIETSGIEFYTYEDVQTSGLSTIIKKIRKSVNFRPLHISFDIDSVDPRYAPATGIPVRYGFTPLQLEEIAGAFNEMELQNLKSIDIVEINPCLGTAFQVDRTFNIAFEFLGKLFSKTGESYDQLGERNQNADFNALEWT